MEIIQSAIIHSIDTLNYDTAQFLAERLVAQDPYNLEYTYLLAKSHVLIGHYQTAFMLLDPTSNCLKTILLFATCCLHLKKFTEGDVTVARWIDQYHNGSLIRFRLQKLIFRPTNENNKLDISALYHIQGSLRKSSGRWEEAKECFTNSISLNPLNWNAYQSLSEMGYRPNIGENLEYHNVIAKCSPLHKQTEAIVSTSTRSSAPVTKRPRLHATKSVRSEPVRAPLKPTLKKRPRETQIQSIPKDIKKPTTSTLLVNSTNNKSPVSSLPTLITTIQNIMLAYDSLSQHKGCLALECADMIESKHYETGFVLSIVARSYFENNQYKKACEIFKKIRQMEPYRVDCMDLYATCLWHIKDKVELSLLGKDLEEYHREYPETWCAIGNYFSLLQEHESAIEAFKRAIQLNSLFTYAHTLLGHEYVANDDLDLAAKCFQKAIQIDHRHYNAIFGLGIIEQKQEKYTLAAFHFRNALSISPNNPILLDSLATVLQKNPNNYQEALMLYKRAVKTSPHQKIFILHLSKLLYQMGEYETVIEILENELKVGKPETSIYFILGKTYAKVGRDHDAITALTLAQDYQEHKPSSLIKDALESLFLDEEDPMDSF